MRSEVAGATNLAKVCANQEGRYCAPVRKVVPQSNVHSAIGNACV